MWSNRKKKTSTNIYTKLIQKLSVECHKVKRAITKWGAIEKSPILQMQFYILVGNQKLFHSLGAPITFLLTIHIEW